MTYLPVNDTEAYVLFLSEHGFPQEDIAWLCQSEGIKTMGSGGQKWKANMVSRICRRAGDRRYAPKSSHEAPPGTKECGDCGEVKSLSDFSYNRKADSYKRNCKPCHALYTRLRTYGFSSLSELEALIESQGGICAFPTCDEVVAIDTRSVVDHDKATGLVRGMLCGRHNIGLDYLTEDEHLAAVYYLRGGRIKCVA